MCIDTNTHKNWNPYRALAVMGAWLALVVAVAFALVGGCAGDAAAQPLTNGSISLAWSITDSWGVASTCGQVGGRSVILRLRPRTGGDLVIRALPCAINPGTAQVAPGVYNIAIDLRAADGTQLASTPDQTNVSIRAGRLTTLTPVQFAANKLFGLVVSIRTPAITNCQSVLRGGAGITGTTIALERTDPGRGRCEAATFTRVLGNTQRGTYKVSCNAPPVTSCIEKTETLTTSVAPGTYLIHVVGKSGTLDCWQREETISVSAAGRPTRHAVGLMRVNGPGC